MTEDILEKAKDALDHAISESSGGVYLDPSCNDLLPICRELIAEVERLRSLENCVSLVIDRQGKTNAALLGQLDVISAYLDAELVEWKNGDQIAEIAIKFMDLQKQKLNDANSQIAAKDARINELEAENQQLIAFCKDYLSANERRLKDLIIRDGQIERLEAAFLKSETERKFYTTINGMNSEFDWNGYPECPQNGIHKEWFRQQARDVLKRIKEEREG